VPAVLLFVGKEVSGPLGSQSLRKKPKRRRKAGASSTATRNYGLTLTGRAGRSTERLGGKQSRTIAKGSNLPASRHGMTPKLAPGFQTRRPARPTSAAVVRLCRRRATGLGIARLLIRRQLSDLIENLPFIVPRFSTGPATCAEVMLQA